MCTRYISPEQREIEAFWKIDRRSNQRKDWENLPTVFPLSLASFIRRADEVMSYYRVKRWRTPLSEVSGTSAMCRFTGAANCCVRRGGRSFFSSASPRDISARRLPSCRPSARRIAIDPPCSRGFRSMNAPRAARPFAGAAPEAGNHSSSRRAPGPDSCATRYADRSAIAWRGSRPLRCSSSCRG